MSGYDNAAQEDLVQRLADTEVRLAGLRVWWAGEQERYGRTEALLEADPNSLEAPA